MPPPVFPPVRPLGTLEPWGTPQTLVQRPRDDAPRVQPILGAIEPADPGTKVRDPWHYAMLNGTYTVTVGTDSLLVCASPPGTRNLFVATNAGTSNLYLNFGQDASTTGIFLLVPGAILLLDNVVPQDDVYAISSAAGGILSLAVSNI